MLSATIVPQGQRIGLPLHSTGKPVRSGDVIEQRAKQCFALPTTHALNVRSKATVHKQYFFACFRVSDNHWVFILWVGVSLGCSHFVIAQVR